MHPIGWSRSAPLAGKKIVIDPGHGGEWPGAIGVTGVVEKDVNLAIATGVAEDLRTLGATVRMTRTTDSNVGPAGCTLPQDLKARAAVANDWKADLFVSCHSNSQYKHDRHGIETYHKKANDAESLRLASDIMAEMSRDLPLTVRGVKPADFYVIKNTKMPSTLVEVAYLSYPDDEKQLKDPAFQKKAAHAIALGIEHYFEGASEPPMGDPTPNPPDGHGAGAPWVCDLLDGP